MVQSIKERLDELYSEFKTDEERKEFERNYESLFGESFSYAKKEFYRIEEQNEKAYIDANKAIEDLKIAGKELEDTLSKLLTETSILKRSVESLADKVESQKDFIFLEELSDKRNIH